MNRTPLTRYADAISHQLQSCGDQQALVWNDRSVTYAELGDMVGDFRTQLAKVTTGFDQPRLLVEDDGSLESAATLAAILEGVCFIPVSESTPDERYRQILTSVAPTHTYRRGGILVDGSEQCEVTLSGRLAYVLFTSGSTGTPKGVPIGTAQLDRALTDIQQVAGITIDDTVAHTFGLTFDLGLYVVLACLVEGATCVQVRFRQLYTLPELLETLNVSVWFSVPSTITMCKSLSTRPIKPGLLRQSMFCGEALHSDDAHLWQEFSSCQRVINFYGPTEATMMCSAYIVDPSVPTTSNGTVPIGDPLASTRFALFDEGRVIQSEEAQLAESRGELLIGGGQVFEGYLTPVEDVFVVQADQRWYRSGDLVGYEATSGSLVHLARTDSQVKVQGYRIELADVRIGVAKALNVPVSRVEITATHTELTAHIDTGGDELVPEVERLRQYLSPYMTPTKWRCWGGFPLNANGKVDRSALAAAGT